MRSSIRFRPTLLRPSDRTEPPFIGQLARGTSLSCIQSDRGALLTDQRLDPQICIEIVGLRDARQQARQLVGLLVDQGLAAFDNEADYVTGSADTFDRVLGASWRDDPDLIIEALSAQLLFYHPKKTRVSVCHFASVYFVR